MSTPLPAPANSTQRSALSWGWRAVWTRVLAGAVVVLPILVTVWVVFWVISFLQRRVIDPLGQWVLWKIRLAQPDAELPLWFERFAAPLIAIAVVLLALYVLGFFADTRLRRVFDSAWQRVPVVSVVYKGVQQLLRTLDKPKGQERPQRVVLIPFPHPGTKVPGFVTGQCLDTRTQKVILCVYVPTTPVPTSGYVLLVPEEEAVELSWTSEQALQTIVSGGLTCPPEVNYFPPSYRPELPTM